MTLPTLAVLVMIGCTAWSAMEILSALDRWISHWWNQPQRQARRTAARMRRAAERARKARGPMSPQEREAWLGGFAEAVAARQRAEEAVRTFHPATFAA